MATLAVGLVLGSGLLHAAWNVLAKRSLNKFVFLWLANLVAIECYAPFAIAEWIGREEAPFSAQSAGGMEAAGYILGSLALHGLYVVLLARTYTISDLSYAYPLMRGTAPLVVPLFGALALHESLPIGGWLGITLIVAGIWALQPRKPRDHAAGSGSEAAAAAPRKAMLLALAVGLTVSAYVVFDRAALQAVPAMTLNTAGNVGNALALTLLAIRSRAIRSEWRSNRVAVAIAGIVSAGGYQLYLFAMPLLPIAQLAPMREIGTVIGTLLGVIVLAEPHGSRRIAASAIITAGIVLLGRQ